jgi:superfamily II DNA helicase RecQ
MRNPVFRSFAKWVVVDEIHLVYTWGKEFRKSYARLEGMWHTLGNKPWFGCTTTLDSQTFRTVCERRRKSSDLK